MSTRSAVRYSKKTTTATARDWNKSFTHMEYRTGAVGQEGFVNLTFQSLLLNIFLRVSWFRSSPLLIHVPDPLYYSPTTCSHYTKVWHRAYPIGDAPQAFYIGAAQLRSVTEIAPKSLLLCVNKSTVFDPVWCENSLSCYLHQLHNGNMKNTSTARAIEFDHSLSNGVSVERL